MTQDPKSDWFSGSTATLGDRIAGAREAAGLSVAEMSQKLGVKIETVESWEHDHSDPRGNKLQMLAGFLNVSIRWLLTGEGDGIGAPLPAGAMTAEIIKALQTLAELRAKTLDVSRELGETEQHLRLLLEDSI